MTKLPREAILEIVDQVSSARLHPWDLRGILPSLAYSPSCVAEDDLFGLAERDERLYDEYGWWDALSTRNTVTAARRLLDLLNNTKFATRRRVPHPDAITKSLGVFLTSDEEFRSEVYRKLPDVEDGFFRTVIEHAIVQAPDTDGILLLVKEAAARNKPFLQTRLSLALRTTLVGHRPSSRFTGMEESFRRPVPRLRKSLFGLVTDGTSEESCLANECLKLIDEILDDYGYLDSEPRHPDIFAGSPWPRVGV